MKIKITLSLRAESYDVGDASVGDVKAEIAHQVQQRVEELGHKFDDDRLTWWDGFADSGPVLDAFYSIEE